MKIESALEQTRGNDNLIENQIWTLFGLVINCFVNLNLSQRILISERKAHTQCRAHSGT